ncbi:flowering-promoting factor 1-like protein 1 [Diospyros lotus]|uniref:flowering-promoting factor 1-like protein 1 n=1 Tax=Diospyros lotus TaxID=55363 RepID=UPI00224E4621|nr:flowering-promoting factor 1-like protein 1 [Diospyros lotus]
MSGVWVFNKKGVARLIPNPTRESFEQDGDSSSSSSSRPGTATAPGARPRVLVYVPANHVIRSYADLELRLAELGWSRYRNPGAAASNFLQFHRSDDSADLISLPRNFADFKPLHMYDIVVKNRSLFEVRHPPPPP